MLKTVLVLGVFAHPQSYRIPVTASEIKKGFPGVSVSDREEHELYYTERDVNDEYANMFGGLHGGIMEVRCLIDYFDLFKGHILSILTEEHHVFILNDANGYTVFKGQINQAIKWLGVQKWF